MNKCVFLDRDGVINVDYVDYVYTIEKFQLIEGVKEGLKALKDAGYLLIIITNQSGISKGIFNKQDVMLVHEHVQSLTGNVIDDIYYCPYHESFTQSMARKPGSLMMEKAMAKYQIDPLQSFMIGDKERDLIPAEKLGIRGILVGEEKVQTLINYKRAKNLLDASQVVLGS